MHVRQFLSDPELDVGGSIKQKQSLIAAEPQRAAARKVLREVVRELRSAGGGRALAIGSK